MIFRISKIDDQEHCLEITLNNDFIKFSFDNNEVYTNQTKYIFELLDNYKKNSYASNVGYEDRKFIKELTESNNDSYYIEYLRIFVCSTFLFHFHEYEDIENIICSRITEDQFHVFDNHFYVDWTGFLGIQPSIYYINHNLLTEKNDDLCKLYAAGFLGKLEIESLSITDTFYFIPFNPKPIPKMLSLLCGSTIKNIMKERDENYGGMNK